MSKRTIATPRQSPAGSTDLAPSPQARLARTVGSELHGLDPRGDSRGLEERPGWIAAIRSAESPIRARAADIELLVSNVFFYSFGFGTGELGGSRRGGRGAPGRAWRAWRAASERPIPRDPTDGDDDARQVRTVMRGIRQTLLPPGRNRCAHRKPIRSGRPLPSRGAEPAFQRSPFMNMVAKTPGRSRCST